MYKLNTINSFFKDPMRKGKGSRGGCDKKGSTAPTERKVTSVFVSRLPLDATEQSIADYFKKCGILYVDPHTGKSISPSPL